LGIWNISIYCRLLKQRLIIQTPYFKILCSCYVLVRQCDNRLRLKWTYIIASEQVNSFVGAFHDAVLLYALALNETLAAGFNATNGTDITQRMWNRTFQGESNHFNSQVCWCKINRILQVSLIAGRNYYYHSWEKIMFNWHSKLHDSRSI